MKLVHFPKSLLVLFLLLIGRPLIAQEKESDIDHVENVVLQLKWFHQFQFAGFYAANIKGFYAEEGLNVQINEGHPFSRSVDKVISGDAHFGVFDSELLLNYANGDPIIALDAFFQSSPAAIAVKDQSNLNSLTKLTNSVIMVNSLIGLTELKAMFIKEGIDADDLNVYQGEYSFEEFVSNDSIDAIHAYYTVDIPKMQNDGLELDIIFPSTYGVDFYGDVLFTTTGFLNDHPDIVQKFRRATKRGWEYARNNQDEIVEYISELPGVLERGMTKEVLTIEAERTWEVAIPEVVPYGYMNPERWRRIAEYYAAADLVPNDLKLDGFLFSSEQSLYQRLPAYIKYGIPALIIITIAISLWLFILRKEVKRRTQLWKSEFLERQKTQKKLAERNKDFETLIENIHDSVFTMTAQGVFTYISPNIEKITGYKPEEIVNKKYAPFFPKNLLPGLYKRLKTRIKKDIDDIALIEIIHKNGTQRWVTASTKVFDHPENGLIVQGTIQDATEKVASRRALRHSEERFRKLTEHSPVGIFIVSRREYIYVNKKYADIFGGQPSDLIGKELNLEFLHEGGRKVIFETLEKLKSGELDSSDQLCRAYDKDGKELFIHFYSSIIDVSGERVLFGTALDITKRISVQKSLEEQQERFKMLTEKSFTGLALIQNNEVIYINPRYLEMLGRTQHEIKTSDDLLNLIHPEDLERVKKSVLEREQGLINHDHYQCRMYHKDGHVIYVDIYGSMVTINGGKAMMASVMDVTDSIISQEHLEKSIQEKNTLLAEIHHRVKNNMAVVSGLMELQKYKTNDEVARSLLNESQLRIKTIAMIHEKLYQSDSFLEIPFGEYLTSLIATISQSLYQESSNVSLVEEYDDVQLNINQAIPAALFVNEVITNCFKHAFPNNESGTVKIQVKIKPGNTILISISDNGKGLPKDYDSSTSLGMTLIHNLSQQIDADLSISSQGGTCFEILFSKESPDVLLDAY
ncbi:MAG: PAS domain S-box protein [Balneola sp.]|nr:PAS domain S-box protein [Balneola sp.]MBO6649783.1 PAS domain S-box protein [Balneola sp.]MBO6712346.1 PAS domain S-box protein [Balneola sp.]MBO6800540.1 PAS domain S-box protein [Balneola sp.]MBO6871494.1 PAS domain S-box protein [Balneola sp.]